MKTLLKSTLLILAFGLFYSCGNISKEVDEKLNEVNNKTRQLDSLVNKESEKVMALDSIINSKKEKLKTIEEAFKN